MPLSAAAIIQQIDELEAYRVKLRTGGKYDDMSDLKDTDLAQLVTLQMQMIDRFAPPGTQFREAAASLFNEHGMTNPHFTQARYAGILAAVKTAYQQGYLSTVQELVHADVFADFLEMADYLLSEGYKDPAAVLAGGVLEESLRKLAIKNGVDILNQGGEPRKASSLNDDLTKTGLYNKLEQKSVTAWLDLRNKAAHGKYEEYDKNQVQQLIQGVRDFLTRHPA